MKSLVPKICVASPAIFSSQHTFLYIKKIFYKNTKAEILRNFKARQFWTGESSGDKVDCKSILRIKTRGWDFEKDVILCVERNLLIQITMYMILTYSFL